MESPNNRRNRVLTGCLLLPSEASSSRTVLHLIELLAKTNKTHIVAKSMDCSPHFVKAFS